MIVHLFAGDGVFPGRVQNGQYSFAIALLPALGVVGGSIVGHPDGFPEPLAVSRTAVDAVTAVSAVCTHAACTVLPGGPGYACPCHGSKFNVDGAVVQGPASAGLPRYDATFDGVTVTIPTARAT